VILVPGIHNSKSESNVKDLFWESVTTGLGKRVRDPRRGEMFRDVERLSQLTVILERPVNGGLAIERMTVPAGQLGVSRKTTRFYITVPQKVSRCRLPEGVAGARHQGR
jgi:hypothetical protein